MSCGNDVSQHQDLFSWSCSTHLFRDVLCPTMISPTLVLSHLVVISNRIFVTHAVEESKQHTIAGHVKRNVQLEVNIVFSVLCCVWYDVALLRRQAEHQAYLYHANVANSGDRAIQTVILHELEEISTSVCTRSERLDQMRAVTDSLSRSSGCIKSSRDRLIKSTL